MDTKNRSKDCFVQIGSSISVRELKVLAMIHRLCLDNRNRGGMRKAFEGAEAASYEFAV